ncbi:hypothetical protein [Bacillus alkalicellulosilyticus]|uniref:hypothetical protein n=1 Tax=Alkalihalobacterium alkalicellulosilyticum TaxID=1912214 RepID=UPI0009979F7A|nr:hypothetical protein [Bacillus alkalicellulosilyticus]
MKDFLLIGVFIVAIVGTIVTGAYVFQENYELKPQFSKDHGLHRDIEYSQKNELVWNEHNGDFPEAIPVSATVTEQTITTAPSDEDIHFASAEEAIAFGLSRLTEEEIDMYKRLTEEGALSEQAALAMQLVSTRFSDTEIAAIEAALSH